MEIEKKSDKNVYLFELYAFFEEFQVDGTTKIDQTYCWNHRICIWTEIAERGHICIIWDNSFRKWSWNDSVYAVNGYLHFHQKEVIGFNIAVYDLTWMQMMNNAQDLTGEMHYKTLVHYLYNSIELEGKR